MGFSYFQNEIRLEILTNVYKIQILYYFIYVLICKLLIIIVIRFITTNNKAFECW